MAIVLVVLAAAACGTGSNSATSGGRSAARRTPASFTGVVAGLCDAQRQATSDAAASRATFFDRAHERLHEIARRLEDVDRTQAGAVLVTMQRAEADMAPGGDTTKLAPDLGALVDATRAGVHRLGFTAPACPK